MYENMPVEEITTYIEVVKGSGFTFQTHESRKIDSFQYIAENGESTGDGHPPMRGGRMCRSEMRVPTQRR